MSAIAHTAERCYWDLAAIPSGLDGPAEGSIRSMLAKLGYVNYGKETTVHVSRMQVLLRNVNGSAPAIRSVDAAATSPSSSSSSSSICVGRSAASAASAKRSRSLASSEPPPQSVPLRRLTVQLDTAAQFDLLRSTTSREMQCFDLVAAMPTTAEAFARACTRKDLDVISLDASSHLDFALRPDLVLAALKLGLCFELRYSGALESDTCRQYFISNSAALIRASRGRGVILSSGGGSPFGLRGHHDLANLMLLCGVRGMQMALDTVSNNCQATVRRAVARRLTKGAKEVGINA